MEKVFSTIRPAWALGWLESMFALLLALAIAAARRFLFWLQGDLLAADIKNGRISESTASAIVDVATAVAIVLIFRLGILIYGWFRKKHYPGSYFYCCDRTDAHSGEKKRILGHFNIICLPDGSMHCDGISFDWENDRLVEGSHVNWESKHVGASESHDHESCYILYNVHENSFKHRPYRQGLLQFNKEDGEGVVSNDSVYWGTMEAVNPPTTTRAVFSLAYAERIGKKMGNGALRDLLSAHGSALSLRFDRYSLGER
jgi:hypothetical protein